MERLWPRGKRPGRRGFHRARANRDAGLAPSPQRAPPAGKRLTPHQVDSLSPPSPSAVPSFLRGPFSPWPFPGGRPKGILEPELRSGGVGFFFAFHILRSRVSME